MFLVPGKGFSLNGPLSSFGEDAFGELYICEVLSGEIYKIIPVAAPTVFDSKPGLPIPDADPVGVSDTINVGGAIPISSVWIGLDIEHTWVGDLCISIEHDGTVVSLIDRPGADTGEPCHFGPPYGCSGSNYDGIVLSDTGIGGLIEFACLNGLTSPPNYVPNEPLGAFAGMDAAGDWTITISDNAGNDLGALNSWSLMIIEQGVDPCIEPCSGDLDGNNDVGVGDLLILLGAWGPNPGHPADFDGNDDVGVSDLLVLLANWGPCP